MAERRTFTGRDRQRRTRWSVRAGDWIARTVITVGGIGTIVAVLLVGVSLFAVAAPLLSSADVEQAGEFATGWSQAPAAFDVDEYRILGWAAFPDGDFRTFLADTGETVAQRALATEAPAVIAAFFDPDVIALGFDDGHIAFHRVSTSAEFVAEERLPDEVRQIEPGAVTVVKDAAIARTAQGQFRRQSITLRSQSRQKVADGPIRALEFFPRGSGDGPLVAVATADGAVKLVEFRTQKNLITGDEQWAVEAEHAVPLELEGSNPGPPPFLRLTGRGDSLLVAWRDGRALRYDVRRPDQPQLVEAIDLVDEGTELTVLQTLLGRTTLMVGDSAGGLSGWFAARETDESNRQIVRLQKTKPLAAGSAAVTALVPSRRTRLLAAGYADGSLRLFHVTTRRQLAEVAAEKGTPIDRLAISPREDGVYAETGGKLFRWDLDAKHPEGAPSRLLSKTWYEGYDEPEHIWQSEKAAVDSEPKFGMAPLIFGTLKATFYAMLFATPLALLGAVYTSEFLDRRTRAKIKPAIETMASLPSVVLGFLAALIFAPFVSDHVSMILAAVVAIPTMILLGAYGWQILPSGISVRFARFRFAAVALLVPAAIALAWQAGPLLERLLFEGNFRRWLDGRRTADTVGSPLGGWLFLLLPLSAVAVALLMNRFVTPTVIRRFGRGDRRRFALIELGKFVLAIGGTLLVDLVLSGLLTALHLDPRSGGGATGLIGTYEQRNAMIVGFVMGFAVIPIIYTIADDALASVPEQLRSASLGAGATQWQTAVRIVIPTAMSGLFSAIMVGLGRAVGETMIVVMATGNTPIMDVNPFNGFRTLSATIAVEIGEPSPGATHYRLLFFCGLALFAMTFCVNTLAEVVRQRFRRRVYQL